MEKNKTLKDKKYIKFTKKLKILIFSYSDIEGLALCAFYIDLLTKLEKYLIERINEKNKYE